MRRDLTDQRDVFFFSLTVISYANSTCKVKKGEDVDESCPQNFFHRVSYVRVLSSRLSPMRVYWLATSVFHVSLSIALGQLSRETLLFSRQIQDPDDKISPREVTQGKIGHTLKIKFPQVNCQQVEFTQVKSLQCDHSYYHTIKAGLVAEVYACAKNKIDELLGVYGTP